MSHPAMSQPSLPEAVSAQPPGPTVARPSPRPRPAGAPSRTAEADAVAPSAVAASVADSVASLAGTGPGQPNTGAAQGNPLAASAAVAQSRRPGSRVHQRPGAMPGFWERHRLAILTAVTLMALAGGWLVEKLGGPQAAALTLYVLSYLAGGVPAALSGLQALRQRVIDVDLLMVLAALGAAGLNAWEEGATLLFLFSLSNALQAYAMDRTRQAIRALMDLAPETAHRRTAEGTLEEVPVEQLQPGDRIVVRPGERIPMDGRVLAGQSTVDQSPITGESAAVAKAPGDEVYAGTLNQFGVLEVEVTKPATDTMLARIVELVRAAQEDRSRTQRRIDRIEQVYATGVVVVAALAALVPLALGMDPQQAVYRALVLMVVASPCAVAISAPAPVLSAVANAARRGVLFKGGRYVEELASVRVVALDKTGTLTVGRPQVTDVVPLGEASEDTVLRLAAGAEQLAEHHLARAILEAAQERGLSVPAATDIQASPGLGIQARVEGRPVWVGNVEFARRQGAPWSAARPHLQRLAAEGKTVVLVGQEQRVIGLIAARDRLRPGAREAVAALRRAGLVPVMLTGDRTEVAKAIAAEVGIDQVRAELLPEAKLAAVDELSRTWGPVAMVGDGVNDAPALARAWVGIAMGAVGTDVALETADVVLVSDEIDKLPFVFDLARRATRTIWQNLIFALSVIALLVVLTLAGRVELALGVLGHEGSTVLAMANGLRMLAVKPARLGP